MEHDMSKIICTCLDLSVQDIADAIKGGARSYEEVVEATDVTTICGVCEENVRELVNELL